ncbi:MAG: hypothetical protein ACRELY_16730, partial [Polyangiaceae bacterium]
ITIASCSGDDTAAPTGGDATTDVQKKEAASANEDTGAVACTAQLPAGYAPGSFVPPVTTNTACTSAQVQAYYDNCYSTTASSSTCTPFVGDAANTACVSCMETPTNASKYGAVLALDNDTALANISGCMAIIDGDLSDTGCGAKVEAAALCNDAACDQNCPIDSSSTTTLNASFKAYNTCEQQAAAGPCATEAEGATTCENDPRYAACKATSFEGYLLQIGDLLCASGNVADAGSDASDASDADDGGDDASDAADD